MRFSALGGRVGRFVLGVGGLGAGLVVCATVALRLFDPVHRVGLVALLPSAVPVGLAMCVVGSLLFSYVEVRESEIVVSQGIAFRETIPLANVASVSPGLDPPWGGIGVRLCPLSGGAIWVVAGPTNLVEIKLKRPMTLWMLRLVPVPGRRRIIVSLDEPGAFIRVVEARLAERGETGEDSGD